MERTHLTERFVEALAFAARAHRGQVRKGTGIPYISHPLQVAAIALEHGADEDQAIAALLHDVIEDTHVTEADLTARFGAKVARIVADCSDAEGPDGKAPWRERKERYLAHLTKADATSALVAVSDKLHNARSIVSDLQAKGVETLDRFNGKRDGTLWYFNQILLLLEDLEVPSELRLQYLGALESMSTLINEGR